MLSPQPLDTPSGATRLNAHPQAQYYTALSIPTHASESKGAKSRVWPSVACLSLFLACALVVLSYSHTPSHEAASLVAIAGTPRVVLRPQTMRPQTMRLGGSFVRSPPLAKPTKIQALPDTQPGTSLIQGAMDHIKDMGPTGVSIPKALDGFQLPTSLPSLFDQLPVTNSGVTIMGHNLNWLVVGLSAFGLVLLVVALKPAAKAPTSTPYPDGRYNPDTAAKYFETRPLKVVSRATQIAYKSTSFGLSLAVDYVTGRLNSNAPKRAKELTVLLTELGPAFIKLGQSASSRSDLLSEAYLKGLEELQDKVPAFPLEEAKRIVTEELGADPGNIFNAGLPPQPIAAASLGQVYKASLKDGTNVAVKVQRPNVEEGIALDMHLIRDYVLPIAKAFNTKGDLQGLADAWGKGFVAELDYRQEALNAEEFTAAIASTPLAGKVFAPKVIETYSARKVLVTEWVDGDRLDQSSEEDVVNLCSVAMISYLTMMLDFGNLHADPHPGNLLRTPDGRLCILDWGMMTDIEQDLRLSLIKHVVHLTTADYDRIPNDLVVLGFVPPGSEEFIKQSGVANFLAQTYALWTGGGGAANIDVMGLLNEINRLGNKADTGLFQIPPYFAYIAKSFSVLEGIGLSVDKNYSIVSECLPYVSQRIITDPDPGTADALATFVFGDQKYDIQGRVLDADRVESLVNGARRYASAMDARNARPAVSAVADYGRASPLAAQIESVADTLLDLLATKNPTPLQDIVIDQVALILGASMRETWAYARAQSGPFPIPMLAPPQGAPPRSLLGYVVDPLGLFRESPLLTSNTRDRKALDAAQKLLAIANDVIATSNAQVSLTPQEILELIPILTRKLVSRREALLSVSQRLSQKVLEQAVSRVDMGTR